MHLKIVYFINVSTLNGLKSCTNVISNMSTFAKPSKYNPRFCAHISVIHSHTHTYQEKYI